MIYKAKKYSYRESVGFINRFSNGLLAIGGAADLARLVRGGLQMPVVDAGGKGLFYIFQGIKNSIIEKTIQFNEPSNGKRKTRIFTQNSQYGFDLQFLVEGKGIAEEEIRAKVETMGESVLVGGDSNLLRVHVHTHDPQAVIEYCSSKGALKDIISENMDKQVEDFNKIKANR